MDNKNLYRIKCNERLMWWKPNRRGYTININEAGKYSYKFALATTTAPYVKDTMHLIEDND